MRFTELICFSLILCLCSISVSGSLSGISKIDKRICELKRKSDSLFFISESFKKVCNCGDDGDGRKNGSRSFEEWADMSRSLWKLESIEWKIFENTRNEESKEIIYYGCWNGPYGKGEVYARKSEKGDGK